MKVTEKLAAYVKDESLRYQAPAGAGPNSDRGARLQSDALESTYTSLLAKLEEARMRVSIEQRQMGEQFNLIDAARLPERPINPTRFQLVALGGAAGLGSAHATATADAI